MKRLRVPVVLLFSLLTLPLFAATPSLAQGDWFCQKCASLIADFNGDGLDDLYDQVQRAVRFNLGAGAFSAPVAVSGIAENEHVNAIGDYNGDGRADLVLWPSRGPHDEGPHKMVYSAGNGSFTPGSFPVEYGGVGQMPPRDFNADGKPDLVLWKTDRRGDDNIWGTLSLMRGNGDGTFTLDQDLTFKNDAYPFLAIADFDGDGHYDVVRTGAERDMLYFHYSGKDGRLGAARARFLAGAASAQAGDANGDGFPDLIVSTQNQTGSGMLVLFNDGRGRFPSFAVMPSTGTPWGPIVADVFSGGGVEIAFTHDNGTFTVYSAAGNELHEIASTYVGAPYYSAVPGQFRTGGGRDFLVTVFQQPVQHEEKLVFVDGSLPEAARATSVSGPRRARAIRNAVASYDAIVTGSCVPPSLNDWSFTREGVFLDFEPSEDGTQILGSIIGDKLSTVVTNGTRRMSGTLTLTSTALQGYLYDRATNPCGSTGRLRVDATRR